MKLCKTCEFRTDAGICDSTHIEFMTPQYEIDNDDKYTLHIKGWEIEEIYVSENFGCVHHKEKTNEVL